MKPVLEKVELLLRTNLNAAAKSGAIATPAAALRSSLGVPVSFSTRSRMHTNTPSRKAVLSQDLGKPNTRIHVLTRSSLLFSLKSLISVNYLFKEI